MVCVRRAGVQPDMMALSKGITAGYFPFGIAAVHKRLEPAFEGMAGLLPHGFTNCGHPVGCAAAMAMTTVDDDPRRRRCFTMSATLRDGNNASRQRRRFATATTLRDGSDASRRRRRFATVTATATTLRDGSDASRRR